MIKGKGIVSLYFDRIVLSINHQVELSKSVNRILLLDIFYYSTGNEGDDHYDQISQTLNYRYNNKFIK